MCVTFLLACILFLSYIQPSSAAPIPSGNDVVGADFWDALPPIDTLPFSDDQLSEWLTDFFTDDTAKVPDILDTGQSRPQTPVNTPVHQTVSSLFESASKNPFLKVDDHENALRRQSSRSRRQERRDISIPLRERGRPLLQRSSTDPHARVKVFQQDRSQSSLRGRKGVYDETREHACEECGKRFDRLEHVHRHVRSVHTKERPFECSICHKLFSRSDNCSQHLKIHNA